MNRLFEEYKRLGQAKMARGHLYGTLTLLKHLKDPRLVRFYGPLLPLKTIKTEYEKNQTGPTGSTPEESAWDFMMALRIHDVIPGRKPPGQDKTDWVEWWKTNQDQYGPVPEPLRDIAEKYAAGFNPSTAASNDKPLATPPRKRVPRIGAKSETAAVSSGPIEPAAASSASVQSPAMFPRWQVLTIASGGMLAAAAWLFSRRRQ